MKTAYKFLVKGMKSRYDGSKWRIGEWRAATPPSNPCVGLNCSRLVQDAMNYVQGELLARVEYGGVVIDSGDKLTCEKMRVVASWPWTKRHSVKLAVYAARIVLPIFEAKYPDDRRPRLAIETVEAWINNPTKGNANAAAAAAEDAAASAYVASPYAEDASAHAEDAAAAAAYAASAHAEDAAAAAASAASSAYAHAEDAAADASAKKSVKIAIHRYALKLAKGER